MRVFLIGDSIRLNSEKYVKENLGENVHLFSPSENCESSFKVLKNIETWIGTDFFDVVHLNCGLHDVRHDLGQATPVSTQEQYFHNLEQIFGILARLDSRLIWATSTPINETVHNEAKVSHRYLKDIIDYNAISVELAGKYGFEVNDLFQNASAQRLGDILLPDGIHFNEAGNRKIGKWISNKINEISNA